MLKGNDGRPFYQNVHIIESTPKRAQSWVMANYPDILVRQTIEITEIENMEEADLYLPGIVYVSGKAYFNKDGG